MTDRAQRGGSWPFRGAVALVALAVFGGLAAYLRSVERAVASGAAVQDQLDAGRLRPLAEVAREVASLKLVAVEVETSTRAERSHESWRGDVNASVTAPTRLLFGVDLSGMDVERLAYSPVSRVLLVRVPAPERIATEVDGGQERTEVSVGWLRSRARAGEYWLGQARRGLYEEARRLMLPPEDAQRVRDLTRAQVSGLISRIAGQTVKVRVVFADE